MFENMTLRRLLLATTGLLLALLIVVSGLGFSALHRISSAADQMGLGKDVVADILPPPLYLIEAELTVVNLLHGSPSERSALREKLKQLHQEYDTRNAYWQKEEFDPALRSSLLGEQKTQGDLYWKIADGEFLPALERGDREAMETAAQKLRAVYTKHRAGIDATVGVANTFAEKTLNDLHHQSSNAILLIGIIGAAGTALALFGIAVMLRQVNARVGGEPAVAMELAQRIAAGDLTSGNAAGTLGILGALEKMRHGLQQMVANVVKDGQILSEAAPRLMERASRAKETAENQAGRATEIATSVEELSASIAQAADNAKHAEQEVACAGSMALEGNTLVQQAVLQMREVADTVVHTVSAVQQLDKQSNEIGRIVQVIREIAEQTNLLALNAAIEAARAGESGRGFAVVADEVRKLAERTSRSTAEIGDMISQIQNGMEGISTGIDGVAHRAGNAAGTGHNAALTMQKIDESVAAALAGVRDVAAALAEQNVAAAQVALAVETIATQAEGSSQRASANADEARNLVKVSESLYGLTQRFRY